MNSAKENADIQSVTADTHPEKSPELEKRRFRDHSLDREDGGRNDDNNNVDLKVDRDHSRPASERSAMGKSLSSDDLRRRGSPPARHHHHSSNTNKKNETEEDQETFSRSSLAEDPKMSPLRIAIGEDAESDPLGKSNIDSLSKTLHINDEIINIIANSKNLIVNGDHVPKEVAAKNERVS